MADPFWKPPNVYDVVGVVGLGLGLVALFYQFRDLKRQVRAESQRAIDAARDEIRRLAVAAVAGGVADAIRWLDLAREACRAKQWDRALDLCRLCGEAASRALAQPVADGPLRDELRAADDVVRRLVGRLRKLARAGAGNLSQAAEAELDDAVVALQRVDGRLRGISTGGIP